LLLLVLITRLVIRGELLLFFWIVASMFDVLLQVARKQETKARESPVLPPLKVLLDWLRSEPDALSESAFSNPM
jgi:hypothetical protein